MGKGGKMSLFNKAGLENLKIAREAFKKTGLMEYCRKSEIIYSPKDRNPLTIFCHEVLSILTPEKTKAVQLGRWVERNLLKVAKLSLEQIIDMVPVPEVSEGAVLVFPENILFFSEQIQLLGGRNPLNSEYLKNKSSIILSDKPYWLYKVKDGTDDFREISLDTMAKEKCFVPPEDRRGLTPTEGLAMFIQDPGVLDNSGISLIASVYKGKIPLLFRDRLGQVVLGVSYGQGWGAPTCAK